MGRLVEVGTPIRITRRAVVRSMVVQLYNYGVQYKSRLKTERYGFVQVVLLFSLSDIYQGVSYEVNSKYGGRETSRCSSVSSRSKDGMAGLTDRYIYYPQITTFVKIWILTNQLIIQGKVFVSRGRQVTT